MPTCRNIYNCKYKKTKKDKKTKKQASKTNKETKKETERYYARSKRVAIKKVS